MITEMTEKQKAKVPEYYNKWLDLGYRTKTVDKKKATKAVHFMYELAKAEKPKYIIYLDSPMACQLACNLIKNTKLDSSQLDSQLYSQLDSQLSSQLSSQLYSQLSSQRLEYFSVAWSNWFGADYVSEERAENGGKMGRSWGCPAVSMKKYKEVIDKLKHGSLLIIIN